MQNAESDRRSTCSSLIEMHACTLLVNIWFLTCERMKLVTIKFKDQHPFIEHYPDILPPSSSNDF